MERRIEIHHHFTPKLLRNERGMVLIGVIILVLILTISGMSYLSMGAYEENLIRNRLDASQAFYAAEAGIKQALWALCEDPDWENWDDDRWGWSGFHDSDAGGNYYQWDETLDTGMNYRVKIRDDGIIRSKIVSSGNVGLFDRVVGLELASAFDYGLYSHGPMEIRDSLTVSGTNNDGYVYAYSRDGTNPIIDSMDFLSADKISGNFKDGPGNFFYLPKEVALPGLDEVIASHLAILGNHEFIMNQIIWFLENFEWWFQDGSLAIDNNDPFNATLYFNNPSGIIIRGSHSFSPASPYPFVGFKYDVEIGGSFETPPNGETIIDANKYVVVKGDATIHNRLTINGGLYIKGDATIFDNTGNEYNGITIGSSGLLYVGGNLSVYAKHHDSDNALLVDGNLYVDGDLYIDNDHADDADRNHCATINNTLFVNGGFMITDDIGGNESSTGRGVIVINNPPSAPGTMDNAAELGDDLFNNHPTHPLFLLVVNDLLIKDGIGVLEDFYGLIYCGGKLSRTPAEDFSLTALLNIAGGSIIAGEYGDFLTGGSITYQNLKSDLVDLGFINTKDFVGPALWWEENE